MARKNILWLCSWYPNSTSPFDGDFIQRHARAAALFNNIHVIHLAAASDGQPAETRIVQREGLTEQVLYYHKRQGLAGHYQWLSLYKQAIREYMIKQGKPALVHVQVPLKAGIPALWLLRRYRIPYVVTEHWGIYNTTVSDNLANRGWLFRWFTRRIFRKASAFVSVSRYLGDAVNRMVLPKPYTVIPNVVDMDLFQYREKKAGLFRFIHVSNMVPLKNAEGILRSFAALLAAGGKAELLMVGDREPGIREYAVSLGLPSSAVRFCGEVPYAQVAEEMKNADALVLFSQIENSPCVIGEALCCGIPVIASAVGGVPELVDPDNSILVPAGDETGLTAALQQMMEDYQRFDRPGIAARAALRFSYKAAGGQLDDLYLRIING